jgi:hypothetical protein
VEVTRADREQLAEAKYLMESVGAAATNYQERVWDMEERSRHNYNHLCYLGGRVYEEMDCALQDVRDYYGGPVIRLPGYPGVNSPPFYLVPQTPAQRHPSAPRD